MSDRCPAPWPGCYCISKRLPINPQTKSTEAILDAYSFVRNAVSSISERSIHIRFRASFGQPDQSIASQDQERLYLFVHTIFIVLLHPSSREPVSNPKTARVAGVVRWKV